MNRRIGLFGGTFNPIHSGHIRIAEEIRRHFCLDSVIFIPTGIPPHKEISGVIDPQHRLEMVRLAIASHENLKVSSIEADRKGISYSIDTIKAMQKEMGNSVDLYMIVGIDAFLDIRTWKDADELMTLCNFIVISRPGRKFRDLINAGILQLKGITAVDLERLDCGETSRIEVPITSRYYLFLEQISPCDISSTELRRLISEGKEVKNLLPESVMLYIITKRLYS